MDCMGEVLRGSWGAGCWCMHPRLGNAEAQGLGSGKRRAAMTRLARRRRAPGLLAFDGDQAVGWIAIAPGAPHIPDEEEHCARGEDDFDRSLKRHDGLPR